MSKFKYQKEQYVHTIPWGCALVKKRFSSEKGRYYKCIVSQGHISAIPEKLITRPAKEGEIADLKSTFPKE